MPSSGGKRPPSRPHRKGGRSVPFVLRLSPQERLEIEQASEARNLTSADYLRRRIFGYQMPTPRALANTELYAQLSQAVVVLRGAGNNLNKLLHLHHSGIDLTVDEVLKTVQDVHAECDGLRKVLVLLSTDVLEPEFTLPETDR